MKIHILFVQRKESYQGQYAPEALVVADEYTMAENPEYFFESCDKMKQEIAADAAGFAHVVVDVNMEAIRRIALEPSSVETKVVEIRKG